MAQVAARLVCSVFLLVACFLFQVLVSLNAQIVPLATLPFQFTKNQSVYVINNGQPKGGPCQSTKPAAGYSSIAQFEGLWFRRFRSRLSPNEPPLQCSYNRFVYLGNGTLINMVNKQFTTTGEWLKENETNRLSETDQSTWINTDSKWHHRIIFFDPAVGVAIDYACINTTTEGDQHMNVGSLYTRSPATNLSLSYLANSLDTFRQNGITDVLPLIPVDHAVCEWENLPKPTHLAGSSGDGQLNLGSGGVRSSGNGTAKYKGGGEVGSKTVFNNGQEKEGQCQATMPPANFSSIAQFEGLWFLRLQSRQRPREPLWKCSYARYLYQGNFTLVSMISKQSVANSVWTHLNETSTLNGNDTSTWTLSLSTSPVATTRSTRVLYLDTHLGTAVVYSCANTAAGHRSEGALLSRSPDTLLSSDYINKVMAVFAKNSIYDILPLHPVNQTVCADTQRPPPANAPDGRKLPEPMINLNKSSNEDNNQQHPTCNCTCPRNEL